MYILAIEAKLGAACRLKISRGLKLFAALAPRYTALTRLLALSTSSQKPPPTFTEPNSVYVQAHSIQLRLGYYMVENGALLMSQWRLSMAQRTANTGLLKPILRQDWTRYL